MSISKNIVLSMITIFTASLLLGCGEKDEAKKLGFTNAVEMKDIQSRGWHTKERYEEDRAKAAELIRIEEMKKAEEAKQKEEEAKAIAAKQAEEQAQTESDSKNKNRPPLRGINDAIGAALILVKNNPSFIRQITTNASSSDISMCASLGIYMQILTIRIHSESSVTRESIKTIALLWAAMSVSQEALVRKGDLESGHMKSNIDLFNRQGVDAVTKFMPMCLNIIEKALPQMSSDQFILYLEYPLVK